MIVSPVCLWSVFIVVLLHTMILHQSLDALDVVDCPTTVIDAACAASVTITSSLTAPCNLTIHNPTSVVINNVSLVKVSIFVRTPNSSCPARVGLFMHSEANMTSSNLSFVPRHRGAVTLQGLWVNSSVVVDNTSTAFGPVSVMGARFTGSTASSNTITLNSAAGNVTTLQNLSFVSVATPASACSTLRLVGDVNTALVSASGLSAVTVLSVRWMTHSQLVLSDASAHCSAATSLSFVNSPSAEVSATSITFAPFTRGAVSLQGHFLGGSSVFLRSSGSSCSSITMTGLRLTDATLTGSAVLSVVSTSLTLSSGAQLSITDTNNRCTSYAGVSLSGVVLSTGSSLTLTPWNRGAITVQGSITGGSDLLVGSSSTTVSGSVISISLQGSGSDNTVSVIGGIGSVSILGLSSATYVGRSTIATSTNCHTLTLLGSVSSSTVSVTGASVIDASSLVLFTSSTLTVSESATMCGTTMGLTLGSATTISSSTLLFDPLQRGVVVVQGTLLGASFIRVVGTEASSTVSIAGSNFAASTSITVNGANRQVVVNGLKSAQLTITSAACYPLSLAGVVSSGAVITATGLSVISGTSLTVSSASLTFAEPSGASSCGQGTVTGLTLSGLVLTAQSSLTFAPWRRGDVTVSGSVASSTLFIGVSSTIVSSGVVTLSVAGSGSSAANVVSVVAGSGAMTVQGLSSVSLSAASVTTSGVAACFSVSFTGAVTSSRVSIVAASSIVLASVTSTTMTILDSASACTSATSFSVASSATITTSTVTLSPNIRGPVTVQGSVGATSVFIETPSSSPISILGSSFASSTSITADVGTGALTVNGLTSSTVSASSTSCFSITLQGAISSSTITGSSVSLVSSTSVTVSNAVLRVGDADGSACTVNAQLSIAGFQSTSSSLRFTPWKRGVVAITGNLASSSQVTISSTSSTISSSDVTISLGGSGGLNSNTIAVVVGTGTLSIGGLASAALTASATPAASATCFPVTVQGTVSQSSIQLVGAQQVAVASATVTSSGIVFAETAAMCSNAATLTVAATTLSYSSINFTPWLRAAVVFSGTLVGSTVTLNAGSGSSTGSVALTLAGSGAPNSNVVTAIMGSGALTIQGLGSALLKANASIGASSTCFGVVVGGSLVSSTVSLQGGISAVTGQAALSMQSSTLTVSETISACATAATLSLQSTSTITSSSINFSPFSRGAVTLQGSILASTLQVQSGSGSSTAAVSIVGSTFGSSTAIAVNTDAGALTVNSLTSSALAASGSCFQLSMMGSIATASVTVRGVGGVQSTSLTSTGSSISFVDASPTCAQPADFMLTSVTLQSSSLLSIAPQNRGTVTLSGAFSGSSSVTVLSQSTTASNVWISMAGSAPTNAVDVQMGSGLFTAALLSSAAVTVRQAATPTCFAAALVSLSGVSLTMRGASTVSMTAASLLTSTQVVIADTGSQAACGAGSGTSLWLGGAVVSSTLFFRPYMASSVVLQGSISSSSFDIMSNSTMTVSGASFSGANITALLSSSASVSVADLGAASRIATRGDCHVIGISGAIASASRISISGAQTVSVSNANFAPQSLLSMAETAATSSCLLDGLTVTIDALTEFDSAQGLDIAPMLLSRVEVFASLMRSVPVVVSATQLKSNAAVLWAPRSSGNVTLLIAGPANSLTTPGAVVLAVAVRSNISNSSRWTLERVQVRLQRYSAFGVCLLDNSFFTASDVAPGSTMNFTLISNSSVTLSDVRDGDDVSTVFAAGSRCQLGSQLSIRAHSNCSSCDRVVLSSSFFGRFESASASFFNSSDNTTLVVPSATPSCILQQLSIPSQTVTVSDMYQTSLYDVQCAGVAINGTLNRCALNLTTRSDIINERTQQRPLETFHIRSSAVVMNSTSITVRLNNSDGGSISAASQVLDSRLLLTSSTCDACGAALVVNGTGLRNSTVTLQMPHASVSLAGLGNESTLSCTVSVLRLSGSFSLRSSTTVLTATLAHFANNVTLDGAFLEVNASAGAETLASSTSAANPLRPNLRVNSSLMLRANYTASGSDLNNPFITVDGALMNQRTTALLELRDANLNISGFVSSTSLTCVSFAFIPSGVWRSATVTATALANSVDAVLWNKLEMQNSARLTLRAQDANNFAGVFDTTRLTRSTLVLQTIPSRPTTCLGGTCLPIEIDGAVISSSSLVSIFADASPILVRDVSSGNSVRGSCRTLNITGAVNGINLVMTIYPNAADASPWVVDSTSFSSSFVSVSTANANTFANVFSSNLFNSTVVMNATSSTCSGGCRPLYVNGSLLTKSSLTLNAVSSPMTMEGLSAGCSVTANCLNASLTGVYTSSEVNLTVTKLSSIAPSLVNASRMFLNLRDGPLDVSGELLNSVVSLNIDTCTVCGNISLNGSRITNSEILLDTPMNILSLSGLSNRSVVRGNVKSFSIDSSIQSATVVLAATESVSVNPDVIRDSIVELQLQDGYQRIQGPVINSTFTLSIVNCTTCSNVTIVGDDISSTLVAVSAPKSIVVVSGLDRASSAEVTDCVGLQIASSISNAKLSLRRGSWVDIASTTRIENSTINITADSRLVFQDDATMVNSKAYVAVASGSVDIFSSGKITSSTILLNSPTNVSSSSAKVTVYGSIGPNVTVTGTAGTITLHPVNYIAGRTQCVINSTRIDVSVQTWSPFSAAFASTTTTFDSSEYTVRVLGDMAPSTALPTNTRLRWSNITLVSGLNASASITPVTITGASFTVNDSTFTVTKLQTGGPLRLTTTFLNSRNASIQLSNSNGTISGSITATLQNASLRVLAAQLSTVSAPSPHQSLTIAGAAAPGSISNSTITAQGSFLAATSLALSNIAADNDIVTSGYGTVTVSGVWGPRTNISTAQVLASLTSTGTYDTVHWTATAEVGMPLATSLAGNWTRSRITVVERHPLDTSPLQRAALLSVRYSVTAALLQNTSLAVSGLRRYVVQDNAANTLSSVTMTAVVRSPKWTASPHLADVNLVAAYLPVLSIRPANVSSNSYVSISDVRIQFDVDSTIPVANLPPATLPASAAAANGTMLLFAGVLYAPDAADNSAVVLDNIAVNVTGSSPPGAFLSRGVGVAVSPSQRFANASSIAALTAGTSVTISDVSVTTSVANMSAVALDLALSMDNNTRIYVTNLSVDSTTDHSVVAHPYQLVHGGVVIRSDSQYTTIATVSYVNESTNYTYNVTECADRTFVTQFTCPPTVTEDVRVSNCSVRPTSPTPGGFNSSCACIPHSCLSATQAAVNCTCIVNGTLLTSVAKPLTVTVSVCIKVNVTDSESGDNVTVAVINGTSNFTVSTNLVRNVCTTTNHTGVNITTRTIVDADTRYRYGLSAGGQLTVRDSVVAVKTLLSPTNANSNLCSVVVGVGAVGVGFLLNTTLRFESLNVYVTTRSASASTPFAVRTLPLSSHNGIAFADAERFVDSTLTVSDATVSVSLIGLLAVALPSSGIRCADVNAFYASNATSSTLQIRRSSLQVWNQSVALQHASNASAKLSAPTPVSGINVYRAYGWTLLNVEDCVVSNATSAAVLTNVSLAFFNFTKVVVWQGGNLSNTWSGYRAAALVLDNVKFLVTASQEDESILLSGLTVHLLPAAVCIAVKTALTKAAVVNRSIVAVALSMAVPNVSSGVVAAPPAVVGPVAEELALSTDLWTMVRRFMGEMASTPSIAAFVPRVNATIEDVVVVGGIAFLQSELPPTASSFIDSIRVLDSTAQCSPTPASFDGATAFARSTSGDLGNVSISLERSTVVDCSYVAEWDPANAAPSSNPEVVWLCTKFDGRTMTRAALAKYFTDARSLVVGQRAGGVNCRTDSRTKTVSEGDSRSVSSSYSSFVSASVSATPSKSAASLSVEASLTSSASVSDTPSGSEELTLSDTLRHTESKEPTGSRELTISTSTSLSESVSLSPSRSASASATRSQSISASLSLSVSRSASVETSASRSVSHSGTVTTSHSHSLTESPTITIDPCNTTFRSSSDEFIRNVQVLSQVRGGIVNNFSSTFFTLDRVEFAVLQTLRVQIGFNTFLRNFYYNTSFDWFPLPTVSGCIAGGYELVNATDFIVKIDYDSRVSLYTGVTDNYFCNLTFTTDIFQCQLMTNFTFNFSATMLVTGTPQVISPLARLVAGLTSSVIAFLSGGAALLQQSRADALAAFSSCQFSIVDDMTPQDSPTQYGFGSEAQFFHRGCVVGNLVLIFAILLGVLVVLLMLSLCCRRQVDVKAYVTVDEATPKDNVLPHQQDLDSEDNLAKQLGIVPEDSEERARKRKEAEDALLNKMLEADDDEPQVELRIVSQRSETFAEAFSRLSGKISYPSVCALPAFMLVDSTMNASVSLIVHPIDPNDSIIGIVGLVFYCLLLVGALIVTAGFVKRRRVRTRLPKQHILTSKHRVAKFFRWLVVPSYQFPPLKHRQRYRYGMIGYLFEESRYSYFICCDLALSMIIGGLLGVGISDRSVCFKLALITFSAYVVFFIAVLYLRPNVNRLSLYLNLAGVTAGLTSATCTVASMATGEPFLGEITQALSFVMLILSILQFVATGIGLLMFLQDLWNEVTGQRKKNSKEQRRVFIVINEEEVDTGSSDASDLEEVDPTLKKKDMEREIIAAQAKAKDKKSLDQILDSPDTVDVHGEPLLGVARSDDALIEIIASDAGGWRSAASDDVEMQAVDREKVVSNNNKSFPSKPGDSCDDDGVLQFRDHKGPSMLQNVVELGNDFLNHFRWDKTDKPTTGGSVGIGNMVSDLLRDVGKWRPKVPTTIAGFLSIDLDKSTRGSEGDD